MMTSKINTGPGDPSWETWSLEVARTAIEQFDANLSQQQAFLIAVRDRIFKTGRLDDASHCSKVVQEMARSGQIPLNPEITDALRDAWAASEYLRTEAYDREVLAEATDSNLYPNAQTYLQIINRRGSSGGWSLNAAGTREKQQREAVERRERLIQTISDGKSTYPLWVKVQGQFRWLSVDSLETESDETLEALWQVVPRWREQIGGSRKQQKKQFGDSLGSDAAKVS